MRDAIEFGIKSFFAGCLGALGVITMIAFATALLGLVFQSQIKNLQTDISGKFQSIPDILNQGPSDDSGDDRGENTGEDSNRGEVSGNAGEQQDLLVYLAEGSHPDNEKLTSLTKEQAANVGIWVKPLTETPFSCKLAITMPDGTKQPIGQKSNPDPATDVLVCGKLNLVDPPAGVYILEAFPEGSSTPAGKLEFEITE